MNDEGGRINYRAVGSRLSSERKLTMLTSAQKQNQPQEPVSSSAARSKTPTRRSDHHEHLILHLQRTIGNQAVQRLLQPNAEEFKAGSANPAAPRYSHDFSRIPVHAQGPVKMQPKLAISTPEDIHEQEADRVAETVMRMRGPEAGDTVQHKAAGSEEAEKDEHEKKLMMAKADGQSTQPASTNPGSNITATEGGGHPLSSTVRDFMEPRFGHDFSDVRVHADAKADEAARSVNALAFTVGRDVVFAAGQYAPDTSAGKKLLAHELTHVIQQSHSPSKIQRKIIIGGKPYTPTDSYYKYLQTNFGPTMVEFIKTMHNDGKPPDFTFTTAEQMGREVRVRYEVTKGMDLVHEGGRCEYFDSAHPDYLDNTYWERKGPLYFVPKSPLPKGKGASDAIEAIFAPGAKTRLECLSMTIAVEYRALLKGLGKDKFDALFPAGAGLEISTRTTPGSQPIFFGPKKLKILTLSSKSELLPGDWVYFKNFKDYTTKHPGGYWQGENAIYMGGGDYRGFGVPSEPEAALNARLVKEYNDGLPAADKKTVADLLKEGGGLQLSPVDRPDIAKLAP